MLNKKLEDIEIRIRLKDNEVINNIKYFNRFYKKGFPYFKSEKTQFYPLHHEIINSENPVEYLENLKEKLYKLENDDFEDINLKDIKENYSIIIYNFKKLYINLSDILKEYDGSKEDAIRDVKNISEKMNNLFLRNPEEFFYSSKSVIDNVLKIIK